jgi:electron-transferring-flavoprotein dehydrogenase
VGCDAGTLNSVKIKGNHTAMKSGMLAAESIMAALQSDGQPPALLATSGERVSDSWLGKELHSARNFSGFMHKFGTCWVRRWSGSIKTCSPAVCPSPCTTQSPITPALKRRLCEGDRLIQNPITSLTFDRLSSVFLSNTNHEEDQPCHLTLKDNSIPISEPAEIRRAGAALLPGRGLRDR